MGESKKVLKSIWGKWWVPIRKWFYLIWLLYETSIRFYVYAQSVHDYVICQQQDLTSYIGETGTQSLAFFCSVSTFVICTFFLTVPTCFLLYKFFKTENLTYTMFEETIKPLF